MDWFPPVDIDCVHFPAFGPTFGKTVASPHFFSVVRELNEINQINEFECFQLDGESVLLVVDDHC